MSAPSPDGPVSGRYTTADGNPILARIDAVLADAVSPAPSPLNVSMTGSDPERGVTLADLTRFTDAAFTLGVDEGSRLKATTSRGGVVRRLETIPAPVPCAPRDLPADDDE